MELLGLRRGSDVAPAPAAPSRADGFTVPAGSPLAAAHRAVEDFVSEAVAVGRSYPAVEPKEEA